MATKIAAKMMLFSENDLYLFSMCIVKNIEVLIVDWLEDMTLFELLMRHIEGFLEIQDDHQDGRHDEVYSENDL